MSLWWLVASSALFLAGASIVRLAEARQASDTLVSYRLRLPRQMPVESVEAFLAGWTGSLPPAWKRWLIGVPPLVIETLAAPQSIRHFLLVPESRWQLIEALLTAHLPSVRYERQPNVRLALTHGAEYRSSTSRRPLAIDAAALSVGLLASLQPLRKNERVVVQYVLGAHGPVQPPRVVNGKGQPWWANDPAVVDSSEAATALRKKHGRALMVGVGRIGIRAGSAKRAQSLLRRTESAWHGTRAPGVHLRRRLLPMAMAAARINSRAVPAFAWSGGALNVGEAAGLVGLPVEIEQLPGLTLGGCRLLPVPQAVPRIGTVIGTGTFPSTRQDVALNLDARQHHLHVTGPTGSGKSVFLSRLALDDLADPSKALVVIDPKDGGLIARILEAMPESRMKDVIVFDPTDDRPVGFDPIRCTPENRELVVDQIVSIMASVWKSSWGPRSADLIRHCLLTLTQVPGMTLVEAPRLLTDPTFRRQLLSQVDDPLVTGSFWSWFNSLSVAEQASIVAPPMNKLRSLTSRRSIRHEIGQANPSIDFDQILNNRGVLLVRLSSGLLGDETASLLGALITAQLWQAVAARASLPSTERAPAMVIIDEVQQILRLPVSTIEDMLTQARGYGVSVTLAHQHLHQLPTDIREAAMSNTRSKVVFACSQKDAAVFAKEFGSGLTVDDLRDIEAHEAVTTIYAAGRTQPPTTIEVLPPATALRSAEVVKALSRARFGSDRTEVEAAILARQEPQPLTGSGGVGRRRRGSA